MSPSGSTLSPLSCNNWRCRSLGSFVHLFHSLEVSFKEMRPFDRLNKGRLPRVVRGLEVFQVHGAAEAVLSHQPIDCGEPLQKPGIRLARR